MTMQISLVYGSTTLNLMANGYIALDGFYPQTATDPETNVTDRLDLWLTAASSAALEAMIADINKAIQYARNYPDGDLGCWLQFAVSETTTAWRTRIYDGMIMYSEALDRHWRRRRAKITLLLTHEPSWERAAELAVSISNRHGAGTGGVTVYNHQDSAHDGYIDIAAAEVAGDLPANCRIEMTNTAANTLDYLWIGQNWTDPANLTYVLEAESAIGQTPIARSSCSNNAYVNSLVYSNMDTSVLEWTLSTAFLDACKGEWFKFLLRFADIAANSANIPQARYRLMLGYGAQWIWTSPWVQPAATAAPSMVRDLATFRLPPWLRGRTGSAPLSLLLQARAMGGANRTLSIDCATLLPVDGFRHLYATGYAAGINERVVDDGIHQVVYKDLGQGRIGCYDGIGRPIQLRPNTRQRLYFVAQEAYQDTHLDWTMSIRVYYRPRRVVP